MYATGGLKKFFRLMAILLAVASVVGLLPLSAIAEGLKGEDDPAETARNAEQMTPEGEDTRAGETYEWVAADTIVAGDEYLIGLVANGTTYLAVNYNVSASNKYYASVTYNGQGSTYLGYSAPATIVDGKVTGVSGNADDLQYCTWKFSSTTGGTITSGYESGRYLYTYTSTSYSDCYPNTTQQTDWVYSNHTLYRSVSSTNRYLQYATVSSVNYMAVNSSVPSGYSVQLYHKQEAAATTYSVHYNVNGTPDAITANTGLADGASVTLPTPNVDFTNYEQKYFIGWTTQAVPTATAIGNISPIYYVNSNSAYYTTPFTVDAAMANANDEIVLYALFGNWDGTSTTTISSETTVTYELVSAPTAGEDFIVVINGYAVGNAVVESNHYLNSVAVTENSNNTLTISGSDSTILWHVTGDNTNGWVFYNTAASVYLGLDSQAYLAPTASSTSTGITYYWTYDGTDLNNNCSDSANSGNSGYYYYLALRSNAANGFTTTVTSGQGVKFYKRVETTNNVVAPAYTGCTTVLVEVAHSHNVTINFVDSNGDAIPGVQSLVYEVEEGQSYSYNVTAPAGYTISQSTVSGVMGNEDVTVDIVCTLIPVVHTITYIEWKDGVEVYNQSVQYTTGDAVTIESAHNSYTGYTMGDWVWHIGSASGAVTSAPTTMPDNDLVAVGTYTKNSHTVTYYSPDNATAYGTVNVLFGEAFPPAGAPADPTRAGYHFNGWVYTSNGSAFSGSTMPDADVIAVASWLPAVTQISLSIVPNSIEIGATATATATLTVAPEAVLGTDYRITWSMSTRAGVVEFVGATQDQTSITLRGLAQGTETITVRVTNVNDNTSIDASAEITVGRYPVGISVTKLPDTVAYTTGSTFDPTGMEVCIEYSDGSFSAPLAASQYTVSAPSMNTASEHVNVTVTYNEDSSWTDSFEIVVYTASGSGTTEVWAPVNSIDPTQDYLIGFVVNDTVYLALVYSTVQQGYYYTTSSYDYLGYTGVAVMDGDYITGVSGNATDLIYAQWNFSTANGGTISSVAQIGNDTNGYNTYYLATFSSTSYPDLRPNSSNTYAQNWVYNYNSATGEATLYRTVSSTNRYAQYYTTGGNNLMCVSSTANATGYVQLYSKQTVGGNHTLVFYKPDGKTVAYTVTVADGGYVQASDLTAAQAAATQGETGTFNGWDYYGGHPTGLFTNAQIAAYPVEEDCYFVANVGNPRYFINFYEQDGSTLISSVSVEQGQPLTDTLLADVNAPTMLGYEFIGWTKDGGATVVTTGDLVGYTPASDESYTAVYRAIEYTLTVHFVDGGNVGLTLPQDITMQVAYGVDYALFADTDYPATITYNNVPYDAAPQAVQGTMPANNLTVNVTYAIRTYTVTFTVNGVNYTQTVAHGACPDKAAFEAACSLPAHMDPNTSMWNSNIPYNDAFTTPVTADVTYTLSIQYEQVTATFYTVQSNTLTDGKFTYEMQWQQSVEYNTKPTTQQAVADVVVDGTTYTFVGWIISTDGNNYDTAHVYSFADLPALTGNTYYRAVYYNTTQDATKRVYVLVDEPVDGQDYVIVDVGASMAATDNNVEGYQYYLAPAPVTLDFSEGGTADYYCYVSNDIADEDILWHFEKSGDNWIIKSNGDNKYMTVTAGSDGYLTALATDSQGARWSYDKTNNRLTLVTPSQTHKYLTFVGNANSGSKFGEYIGLSNKDIVMNAIEAAQDEYSANNEHASKLMLTREDAQRDRESAKASYSYSITYHVGNITYTDSGNAESFTFPTLATAAPNFNFADYEQTNFIGWYPSTYALSNTAPTYNSLFEPGYEYSLSSALTADVYAMFATDTSGNGTGIKEIASNHSKYTMETATGTLHSSSTRWIFLMDAYNNRSLYASAAAGYVYSDTAYTRSSIVTDAFGNKVVDVANSDYNHMWRHYYNSSSSDHQLDVQATETGVGNTAWHVYYTGSSNPYSLYMNSSSHEPIEFTYGGTDSYGTYYSMVIDGSWYVYYNTSSSRYYEGSGTTYSNQSRYYVFAWDTYPYVITSANGYTTTPTAVAATNYTLTVTQPTGGTVEVSVNGGAYTTSSTTAPAGATVNVRATAASGYQFVSWNITGASLTREAGSFTMPSNAVTVSATFTYNGGSQPGSVYYEPTSTIVVGEEYLIGYKDGSGNVYLLMNYNPNPVSNNRYVSINSTYYSYGIRAQMSGNNVVGVYNDVYANATINNAEWIFEQNGTGYYKIQSARTEDNGAYYLRIYQSTLYSDLYAANSGIEYYGHQWQWDPANNRLSFYYDYNGANLTKYVTYNATAGSYSNLFDADTTPATVQLYRKMTGSVSDRRFTLSDSATATIKLYGISEQTGNPSVSVTPNSKTIYWYDENVVWYDETAEVVQSVTLAGENHNIAAGDIQNITWSASESGIVTLTPSADGSTCTVTSAAVGNVIVTYSVTDIFGNVYTAEAQIVVQQAPTGEIPEDDDTWYTGGPEYKVYIETDHFEAGEKYVIARDYTTSSSSTSITVPYYQRVTSMSTGNTYAIVYGDSSTLANCTTLKALRYSTTSTTSGSYEYRYKRAFDVLPVASSDNTVFIPSYSVGWTLTSSGTSGYYYLVSDDSDTSYPYLFSNTTATSAGVYNYLNTTSSGSDRGSWSYNSTNSRFYFRNYYSQSNSLTYQYINYDSTNDRFTVGSSAQYFYIYRKYSDSMTFSADTAMTLTAGSTTSSACYTLSSSNSTLLALVKANLQVVSSNENVVTVNDDGTLNALMPGTACVTVSMVINGTAYMKEITVKVIGAGETAPATTALHALRDASLYGQITIYPASTSSYNVEGMHYIEGTPVILYPGNSDTNNVAFVAVDPILEDAVTWEYSSTGLKNMSTETYMTGFRYYAAYESSSSYTIGNTIRLTPASFTDDYASKTVTYSGSIGTGSTLGIGSLYARYTPYNIDTLLAGEGYTGSVLAGDNFRIFKLSTVTYNPGVHDDAIAGVDIFSNRVSDGDRQYISQTSAVYNDVDASEQFTLDYELIDMPTGYEIHEDDCEWELREQSMIMVNGTAVPLVTGFDEATGTFIINPALANLDEWEGYIVVGYVYAFTYPGDEYVHEAANYGKIYFSSGTYQMTQDDLPDFPEPGYVGLDKTAATPYGAFINTGIGKVELTNFGIPSSKPVDVVLILDISGSMDDPITGTSTKKMKKAKEAAIEFANTLLEGSDNSLSIVTFSNGATTITGSGEADNSSFIRIGSVNGASYLINQIRPTGGTNFDAALQTAYRIMYDNYNAYGTAHNRAVVFMTDGAPGFYNNISLNDKLTGSQTGNWKSYDKTVQQQAWDYWCLGSNSSYSMSSYFTTAERYNYSSSGTNMYLDAMKAAAGTTLTSSNFTNSTWVSAITALDGVTTPKGLGAAVYTVGFDIANSDYINAQSDVGLTGTSAAAVMRVNATSASYYHNADADTDLTDVFVEIAQAIRLVAENAVSTDTISEYFDLNVDTGYSYQNSSNQTVNSTATGSNQIVYGYYELDDNYNVKHDSNNQPIFHAVETVTITGTNNAGDNYEAAITSATSDLLSGNIYNSNSKKIVAKWFTYDVETKQFEWHINEGDKMEDKKMYSLSFSVRLLDEYRVDGSTYYPTNAHAELNYDDVNGHHTELPYPIPELPWAGAQVHYEFYLVNEEGQPIDSAGNVVPFSQRVVVYTGTVDKFHPAPNTPSTITYRADEILAAQGLAYTPYEPDAESSYSVTISDDSFNNGSATLVSGGATYVTGLPDHNTPYNVSGTYTYNNGAPVNTYVSFPVVFKLAINPDVIIVDYAVGVDVDVLENDLLPGTTSAAPLYAVGSALPTTGTMSNAYNVVATANLAAGFVSKANGALTVTDAAGYTLGTAQVVTSGTKNVLRFTPTEYMISNPQVIDLYCAVQGRIPAADGATVTQRQAFMYEKLTVVPANVMYYDDTYFNTTANFNNGGAVGAYINGTGNTNGNCEWQAVGTTPDALQHTSRVNDTGKDDVHGYDAMLANSTGRSFDTYHTVTVPQYAAGVEWPTMSFTFRGKGLEIVTDSMTETGIMSVVITRVGESSPAKRLMIDTYYSSGDLTQIPTCRVMMNSYGVYDVTISVIHNAYYSNLHGNDSNELNATVTIDAVRVFEPIDCASNETVRGYYAMNNQAFPKVQNVQDIVIDSINLTAYNDVALYKYENGAFTLADGIGAGTYAIYSTSAKKVLGYSNNAFTAYDATVSGSTLTVDSNVDSNLYLWTFAESGIEAEDGYARYTIRHSSGKYLTVANANSDQVEYGELSTTATVPTAADFSNQWTLDGNRLVTGPMKQILNGNFFRDLYYSVGYFTSFRANATVKPGAEETNAAMNGLLMLDGGTTTDPEIYKTYGPNNEVYVMPGSALTFKLVAEAEPAGVYLEMKSPYGTAVNAYMYSSTAVLPAAEGISTATGMYYNITDRVVWHKGNGVDEDSRLYYSAPFIVLNGTESIDIEHVISLSNIKFTFANATSSGSDPFASKMSAAEYERTINTFERDQWKLYGSKFDLNVHTASVSAVSSNGSGISRFNEAYITVATSTDVGGLVVRDVHGNLVNVKNCTYTDNNGVRTWKLTIDRASAKSYNVYVTTVSAVFDMENPVSFKTKVPALTVVQLPHPGAGRGVLA